MKPLKDIVKYVSTTPESTKKTLEGVHKSSTSPASTTNDKYLDQHAPDDLKFVKQHEIEKHDDRVGNDDDVYKGKTKPALNRPENSRMKPKKQVDEAACNHTESGVNCPVHGLDDCSGGGKKLLIDKKKKLSEVLTKNTSKEKVIDDFVHSKNAKFSGDSKKERIKRALGAYYGMHKEDAAEPMLEGGKKKKKSKIEKEGGADTPMTYDSGMADGAGRQGRI